MDVDERAEAKKLKQADEIRERHRIDADAEISQQPSGGFDVDEEAFDDGDDLSVASAPPAPGGEEDLNGWNELTWPGDIRYKGYWRENHMHGKGMLVSESGTYSGDFIMHKMCGVGRYDFHNGSIYIGEFSENLFHGQGILGYDQHIVYEGEFFEGLRQGEGTMVFANGDTYEGGWSGGVRTGRDGEGTTGIYVAHNGHEVYDGGFLDNKRHGAGSLWIATDSGRAGEYTKQAVTYDMGKLSKHRARPSCRPSWPVRKPLIALAKARSQNANWGAGEEVLTRPASAKAKTPNTAQTEEEDEDFDENDPMMGGAGGSPLAEGENYEDDQDDDVDARLKSAADDDDEGAKEPKKKSLVAKMLGGCLPWLSKNEEDEADIQEQSKFDGKPNSLVIVVIEKCVDLPALVNNESSNPYVEIKSRGKRYKTQVVKETVEPLFQERIPVEHNTEDDSRDLEITVYHSKFGGGKQFLGKLYIDLRGTRLGQNVKAKAFTLKEMDGVTTVTCKAPGSGKSVDSAIHLGYSLSLIPESLVSIRLANARNIDSPDTRGLGFPFVKVKFDDRVNKSISAQELEHPRWDQSISFDTLSATQLMDLPPHAKPGTKVVLEVWDSKAMGDDIFIGSCETDIQSIRYETRSDMQWHRLSDKTRTRRANVGDIKFSIAWGPNEKTILTVQIEEGYALTKYLQSSLMSQGRRARSFFSNKKDEDKKETLPSAFLKFSIDSINKRKTKVIKDSVQPQWNEKHHFQVLQSELPTSMLVQCFHSHLLGEEFIGMVSVDLQLLELNRSSFVRWYRLQDVELQALADQKKRAAEKAKAKEKALLEGKYVPEDDEDEEILELDEEEEELNSHLSKSKGGFLSRMSGVNNERAHRMALLRALNGGKNPEELGRVRIRLSWSSIEDEEEKACQAIWAQKMQNPRKRKLMKKVMVTWIRKYQVQGFEVLKRQATIQIRMENEALARYRESTLPRFYALWQGHMHTLRLCETCAYHYNLRCRQKPFFEAWVFEVDKGRKRDRIKAGLYPGDPDDLPIQKPLEMFNIVGADFLDPKLIEKDRADAKLRRSKSQAANVGTMAGALRQKSFSVAK